MIGFIVDPFGKTALFILVERLKDTCEKFNLLSKAVKKWTKDVLAVDPLRLRYLWCDLHSERVPKEMFPNFLVSVDGKSGVVEGRI